MTENQAFKLDMGMRADRPQARLMDKVTGDMWADGRYHWSLLVRHPDGVLDCRQLQGGAVRQEEDALALHARIGGLTLEQRWRLPAAAGG